MTRYKLYILKPGTTPKCKYVLMSPSYTLVYTSRKPKGGTLVSRPEVLNNREKAWVMACNLKIQEELFEKSRDTQEAMQAFLKDLEAELKAEQEALKKGG